MSHSHKHFAAYLPIVVMSRIHIWLKRCNHSPCHIIYMLVCMYMSGQYMNTCETGGEQRAIGVKFDFLKYSKNLTYPFGSSRSVSCLWSILDHKIVNFNRLHTSFSLLDPFYAYWGLHLTTGLHAHLIVRYEGHT